MSRLLYSIALYILLPFTAVKLLWRGLRQPAYLNHWAERYGWYTHTAQQAIIWLHCVSVGETRAAKPLIDALLNQYPKHQILLTHATPTGREAGEQLFPTAQFPRVSRCYLPYDVPGAVKRFLKHFQPALGLLMETELWFNLIAQCKAQNIPLLLVNARLSERSARGYAKVGKLTAQGLNSLSAIAAQTNQDAVRLDKLIGQSGKVAVMGNLKFDVHPPAEEAERGRYLRGLLGVKRPVFLAASTRDGEEALILEAITSANIPNLLTVIVPRHPQRFDEVAALLSKQHIAFCRRSEFSMGTVAGDIPNCSVVLGDSMGELFTYYAACDLAFIGGSLLPLGGQNLIEASAMGKPVLIGPHTFNFSDATELAVQLGAASRVSNPQELAEKLSELMNNQDQRKAMSDAALAFSKSAGGATQKLMRLIAPYLAKQTSQKN
ncbi:MAG: lipid IV(A) 3-deoxy-D-manno-octulosonic acid transferase [Candidatus Methylopumilus sp.]